MHIKNLKVATIFRILLIGVCIYGLVLIFGTSMISGWDLLSFYTNDSNIVVLIFFSWLIIHTLRHPKGDLPQWYPVVKGSVVLCIMLTFLVYHFVLTPTMFNMVEAQGFLSSPANIVLHYIVPLMTLADWLLFDKKGGFKKSSPFVWLAIPAAYLLFSLIRAHFATYYNGGRYPYFFINIDTYGIERVAWNVLVLGAFLLVIGYCFYALDWGLARLAKKAKSKRNRR